MRVSSSAKSPASNSMPPPQFRQSQAEKRGGLFKFVTGRSLMAGIQTSFAPFVHSKPIWQRWLPFRFMAATVCGTGNPVHRLFAAPSARGLAHSKTLRVRRTLGFRASVLDCGGPPPPNPARPAKRPLFRQNTKPVRFFTELVRFLTKPVWSFSEPVWCFGELVWIFNEPVRFFSKLVWL